MIYMTNAVSLRLLLCSKVWVLEGFFCFKKDGDDLT